MAQKTTAVVTVGSSAPHLCHPETAFTICGGCWRTSSGTGKPNAKQSFVNDNWTGPSSRGLYLLCSALEFRDGSQTIEGSRSHSKTQQLLPSVYLLHDVSSDLFQTAITFRDCEVNIGCNKSVTSPLVWPQPALRTSYSSGPHDMRGIRECKTLGWQALPRPSMS
jgi:hypothetical protein